MTIEQLLNYNKVMEIKKTDCEAINPEIVEKVMPDMPDLRVLYDLWAIAQEYVFCGL